MFAVGYAAFYFTRPQAVNGPDAPPAAVTAASQERTTQTIAAAEVALHSSRNDCWTIIDGKVYDVTSFIPGHPGGNAIAKACGIDATDNFKGVEKHSNGAVELLPTFLIGNAGK